MILILQKNQLILQMGDDQAIERGCEAEGGAVARTGDWQAQEQVSTHVALNLMEKCSLTNHLMIGKLKSRFLSCFIDKSFDGICCLKSSFCKWNDTFFRCF